MLTKLLIERNDSKDLSQSLCFQGFMLTEELRGCIAVGTVSIPLFSGLHADNKATEAIKLHLSQSLCFQGFMLTREKRSG